MRKKKRLLKPNNEREEKYKTETVQQYIHVQSCDGASDLEVNEGQGLKKVTSANRTHDCRNASDNSVRSSCDYSVTLCNLLQPGDVFARRDRRPTLDGRQSLLLLLKHSAYLRMRNA